MTTTALAQEKIWLDKSSYDKAERVHHEKLAKVLPVKIKDENSIICNSSAFNEFQTITNATSIQKSKSKKVKFSKLVLQDISVIESSKNLKNSKKGKKKEDVSMSESVKINENIIPKNEDNDVISNASLAVKKYKAKEAKEKKNKADKKQRTVEEDKISSQDYKDQLLTHQGSQPSICSISPAGGSLANEVAKARQHIKQSLQCMDGIAALAGVSDSDVASKVVFLEKENQVLHSIVQELRSTITKLDSRVTEVEGRLKSLEGPSAVPYIAICPQKPPTKDDNDDDVDLFGSDSEGDDAEAAKIREERLAAYAAKKSKKPALIAKSNIILDVKPWDDETDMKVMEAEVRKIQTDGLLWGAAKLVPVAFKIQKLQISCVVEDDKVSVDWLTEAIEEIEEYVQSVDIAAFNKV